MWTRKHSLRFWDRILGFKISSVMLLGNQPRSWSCRRSPKIQPRRDGRRRVTNSLQVARAGPPSGAWGAGGRETAKSGWPSQGLPALTPADGKAQTGGTPRSLPSWGARRLCPGRRRSRPHPMPLRVPHALTLGPIPKPSAISGCLTCGQETPGATPKSERHQGAGGMAAGPGCHRHPLVGQPFPEPQAPES